MPSQDTTNANPSAPTTADASGLTALRDRTLAMANLGLLEARHLVLKVEIDADAPREMMRVFAGSLGTGAAADLSSVGTTSVSIQLAECATAAATR